MRIAGKITIAVAAAASLVACGDSEQAAPSGGGGGTAVECTAEDIKVSGGLDAKPQITMPTTCSAPKALLSKDLVAGSGPEVKAGSSMLTHYVLVTWSNKQEKDSSWKRGEPFPLDNVGQARVIDGWNEGLIGIKQGTRRLLVVPPEKGYGPGGNGIAPNETLVFVIDAVEVT
ncbi:FKBP-type peptidyl-prolyl cis-trans isomerase [Actinokineospora sp.]|uniref:FKBP-type peptidyl-prolyl cis-trans isomerase n=1 Tax=Actinokineospora sp. TaxID=1872133 RepID=UPI004037BCB9